MRSINPGMSDPGFSENPEVVRHRRLRCVRGAAYPALAGCELGTPGELCDRPEADLRRRYAGTTHLDQLSARLDSLAGAYRCGTLVVLQALRRASLETFANFDSVYEQEVTRLKRLSASRGSGGGGNHYLSQPYRVGNRLSRALIADAIEGRTPLTEALGLMSMKSLKTFDEYARRLGVVA